MFYRAVKERQYYKMTQIHVQMAVLVQPLIINKSTDLSVVMNGVCITHDSDHHNVKHAFVVNT